MHRRRQRQSRTLLFDIRRLALGPVAVRGRGRAHGQCCPGSSAPAASSRETDPACSGRAIPIAGIAGDQQAATFGQACLRARAAKNTYGTGAFLLRNAGTEPVPPSGGSADHRAVAAGRRRAGGVRARGFRVHRGRRGPVAARRPARHRRRGRRRSASRRASAGTRASTWCRRSPAWVRPWWDPAARGLLIGITRGTGLPHIARATIDSIAYQVRDVLAGMDADTGGAAVGAARGRRRRAQRRPAPVPGRPAGRARGATRGHRDDRGGGGLPGRAGRRLLVGPDEVDATWALDRRFEPTMASASGTDWWAAGDGPWSAASAGRSRR